MARHFTVEEANELVPTLTAILEDLQSLISRMRDMAGEIQQFEALAAGNGHGEHSPIFEQGNDIQKLRDEVRERLLYLHGVGVLVKDVEKGVLDFPTRMFGRDVYLCWRLGEESVTHWHDVDSGFAGRQPL